MKTIRMLLLVATICCDTHRAVAQTWTQTSLPTTSWSSVASSADGTKLIAIISQHGVPFGFYTSTNSGVTWTKSFTGEAGCVASSADGSYLVALDDSLPTILTSTNYGSSWHQNLSFHINGWVSVASSANGSNLVAITSAFPGTTIYTSKDAGTTWATNSLTAFGGYSVASSTDGNKLVVALGDDRIYTSTNSGTTWRTNITLTGSWITVASSADGSKLVAAAFGGKIYTSTNSGTTWKTNSVPVANWNAIASSADGTKLVAAIQSGQIYTSTNSGAIWKTNNAPNKSWTSVASSADGNLLVAADYSSGGVWIAQNTPTPKLNLSASPGQVMLSWLVPSTNFVMQQSSDLASWSSVTDAPVLNLTNLQNQVILLPTNSSGFYRLATP